MSHKEKCINYCREQLQNLNLLHYYSEAKFNHVYRKQNGAQGNAWIIGLNAADYILFTSKPTTHDERSNESQA